MKNKMIFIAVAIDSIEAIASFIAEYSEEEFMADRKTQDAVIRNLEIIGQALKDFGVDALSEINPTVPWYQICGMRNVLAHEYFGVDIVLIWETVTTRLDVLREALEEILL